MNYISLVILIVLICIGVHVYRKNFKSLKCNAVSIFTGAPKTGKSTLAIFTAYLDYRRILFKTRFANMFRKLFNKPLEVEPLMYSNIPLAINEGYVPLTKELLLGQEKFVPNSIVYIGEVSLVADSMTFKQLSSEENESIMLFNKLAGHRSIRLYYDTQTIKDTIYHVKRCLSEYYYIHHMREMLILPFLIVYVREERYSDDESTMNVYESDTEETLKKVLIPKSIWKKFDYKCYSNLAGYQEKPVANKVEYPTNLKAEDIVSFKEYKTLNEVKH